MWGVNNYQTLLRLKLPKSTGETQNVWKSMDIITNSDENIMFLNYLEHLIEGFSTKINLDVLCNVNKLYAVGTFKNCPKYFI